MALDVAIGNRRATVRGKDQCGENAQQRGLSRAILPYDCYRFTGLDRKGNPGESALCKARDGIEQRTPP
jgi:hypothetical protein